MNYYIYLAGPIGALHYNDAKNGWRRDFVRYLPSDVKAYSPLRALEFLENNRGLLDDVSLDKVEVTPAGVTTRDFNDIKRCDAVVACYLDSEEKSLGTAWELGVCYALQKPVVLIGRKNNPNVKHAMIHHTAGYIVDTLKEGAKIVVDLLKPGV